MGKLQEIVKLTFLLFLAVPSEVFGGSIRVVWRLHSGRLEAPFTPFGGSKRSL